MTACRTGKTGYPSPQAAWHAADILRHKRLPRRRDMAGHSHRTVRAYRCRWCHQWHITSSRDDDPRPRTA